MEGDREMKVIEGEDEMWRRCRRGMIWGKGEGG